MKRPVALILFPLCILVGAPLAAQNLDMGSTYRDLDAEVEMLMTTWPDAIAVTTRPSGPSGRRSARAGGLCRARDGALETRVYDAKGRVRLFVCTGEDGRVEVRGPLVGDDFSVVESTPIGRPTTDWANLQAYSLWRDLQLLHAETVPDLRWSGNFLRPEILIREGDDPTFVRDLLESIEDVQAVFSEVIASTMAIPEPAEEGETADQALVPGRSTVGNSAEEKDGPTYATFSTVLVNRRSGEWLGGALWFGNERIYSWNFGDLTSGLVSDERIPGGIPFTPNLAWSNIQSYAFWKMHGALEVPFNDPGCDGLHWLDNTIFRPCCDEHDRCYEKWGCTYKSWFFVEGWKCTHCNLAVVFCFVTLGPGDPECEICCGEPCPPQCVGCRPGPFCDY